jgi:hypothetical protein
MRSPVAPSLPCGPPRGWSSPAGPCSSAGTGPPAYCPVSELLAWKDPLAYRPISLPAGPISLPVVGRLGWWVGWRAGWSQCSHGLCATLPGEPVGAARSPLLASPVGLACALTPLVARPVPSRPWWRTPTVGCQAGPPCAARCGWTAASTMAAARLAAIVAGAWSWRCPGVCWPTWRRAAARPRPGTNGASTSPASIGMSAGTPQAGATTRHAVGVLRLQGLQALPLLCKDGTERALSVLSCCSGLPIGTGRPPPHMCGCVDLGTRPWPMAAASNARLLGLRGVAPGAQRHGSWGSAAWPIALECVGVIPCGAKTVRLGPT